MAGRKFTLMSDHRPLVALFWENRSLPVMAAGRLQRWAAFSSEFDYEFKHVDGHKNVGADSLSRLPLNITDKLNDSGHFDYLNFIQAELPVDAMTIRSTCTDRVLGKVCIYINNSWPKVADNEIKAFAARKNELNIDHGIVMWSYRAIIPEKIRTVLLKQFHSTHMGMSKMKSLARGYFWYPNLDKYIEVMARICNIYASFKNEPEKTNLIKWKETIETFKRVHLDFFLSFLCYHNIEIKTNDRSVRYSLHS